MTDYRGVTWRVNYGEIAERDQFRVGYINQESYDAYFEVGSLADLIAVLNAVVGLNLNQLARGTYLQARKVSDGLLTSIRIEPRLDTGTPAQIMQLKLVDLTDLLYALGLFQADLTNALPDDWDISEKLPVAVLDAKGRLPESTLPDRLSQGNLDARYGARLVLTGPGIDRSGVSNSATALNSLLATALPGTVVELPPGSYRVTSTVVLPTGIVLEAHGAKIFSSSHITTIQAGNGVTIEGLELQGAGNSTAVSAGRGISHTGPSATSFFKGLTLRDCYIHDFGFYGVVNQYASDILIENCVFEHLGYCGVMNLSVSDVLIANCVIRDVNPGTTQVYGVAFTKGGTGGDLPVHPLSRDCTVRDCVFEDIPTWDAMNTHAGIGIRFEGNTVRRCLRAVSIVGAQGMYAPQHCSVVNNRIYGCTVEAIDVVGSDNGLGTPNEYAAGCIISGNYIEDSGQEASNVGAIQAYVTDNLVITGNVLVRPVRAGIVLYNTNRGFAVTGNTIIDPHSSSLAVAPAVHITSEYNTGVIADNVFLRVNAALDTYVGTRGVRAETANNNSLTFGNNYITCSVDYSGVSVATTRWAVIGQSAGLFSLTSGTPEGAISASPGSLCTVNTGGAGATLFEKRSGTGVTGWAPLRGLVAVPSNNLTSASNSVNTVGKAAGVQVWDTTLNKPLWATGSSSTSTWVDSSGAVVHTPA